MVRTICLHGSMATELGSSPIRIDVDNVQDLMLAMRSIYKDFRQYVRRVPELVFIVSEDNQQNPKPVSPNFIGQNFGEKATEVHVIPALEGAGIEIIATAGLTGWALVGAYAVNIMASMVISMALGALIQAIAPSPSTSAGSSNQVAENASFLYNGAVNVTQQGGPVPLVYGDFLVGSVVVSVEVNVDQLLSVPAKVVEPPSSSAPTQPDSPPVVPWQWTGAYVNA